VKDDRWERYLERERNREELIDLLETKKIFPVEIGFDVTDENESAKRISLKDLLKRPDLRMNQLFDRGIIDGRFNKDLKDTVETEIKYEGYLKHQHEQAEKMRRWENVPISTDFDYDSVKGLSNEGRQKFKKVKPLSIGQAGRIEGVRPADIWLLIVYLNKK
jgi:tRNA uridine 5-carboxymethylaminomethyl modification enzyme